MTQCAILFHLKYDYLFFVFYWCFCCNRQITFIAYEFSVFENILRSDVNCTVAPFKRV